MENNRDKNRYRQELTGIFGIEDSRERMENKLCLTEHTLWMDFTNPINEKHSWFLTAKFVTRWYRSDEELDYNQYVPSFRASYSFSTAKINLRAEVSFEKTINDMQFGQSEENIRNVFFDITPSAKTV